MIGELITRNTKLKASKGKKVILVFGIITVPDDAPVGDNRVVHVHDDLTIDMQSSIPLSKKLAAWDAPEVCEEMFGMTSMREEEVMKFANRGLALIKDGDYGNAEAKGILKSLKGFIKNMPPLDSMKFVFESIVKSFEAKKNKIND